MRLLSVLCAAALLALSTPAGADPLPIEAEGGRGLVQPGMLLTRNGLAWCTGGFVFDGENVHVGDKVGYAGWGLVTDRNSTTRERRIGVLNNYDEKLWGAGGPGNDPT